MRIIGGRARGLKLAEVGAGDPKAQLRPTSDRVREAIFNLLVNGGYGNPLQGARVLDVFAGTGALGLEALSRGSQGVTFIETGKVALGLLARNIALMKAEDCTTILRRDALQPGTPTHPHDVVFLDPPYGRGMGEAAMSALLRAGWLAPGALVIWEEGSALPCPEGFEELDRRKYGDTHVAILQPS